MEFVKYVVEEFKDIVDVVELIIVVVLKEVVFMLVWLNVVEVSEVINIVVVEVVVVVVVVDRHWSSQFNREQRDLLLHMVFEQSRQGQRTFLRQPSSTPTHLNRVSRHLFLDF